VILASQSPIGPFEGVGIRIPADTKQLVIIGHQLDIPEITVKAGG